MFVALLVACASCSGDGVGLSENGDLLPMGPDDGVRFQTQVQPIFDASCTRCHIRGGSGFEATGGEANNGLDLTSGNSHARLVDQRTFEEPDTPPRWRVRASEPDSSYILQKISSDTPKFGSRMPLGGPDLSESQIETIRTWIAQGARDN
jgi:mono/diheme cytochrome c family protein